MVAICNKLVVLLLGVSGALTVFGPAQLYLGALGLVLPAWALRVRARALVRACPVSAPRPQLEGAPGP